MRNLSSILILALLGLCFSSEVLSQTVVKYQDYASRGNVSATIQGQSSAQKFPQVFPGATVTVYATGTTNLSTIYSNTGLTTKANPFTATSEGYFEFYAIPGTYDIRFSGTGISVPFTRSGVEIQIGSANILGGTIDYIQKKASSSAIGDSLLYEQGGAVRAPTATTGTSTTQIATTAFTQQEINARAVRTDTSSAQTILGTLDAGLPTSAFASLPASPTTNRRYRLTDKNKGTASWNTNASQWVLDDPRYDPRNFGCKCDGSTDDTTNYLAAATAAVSANAPLYQPPCTMILDSLTIPGALTIIGEGETSIIKRKAVATNASMLIASASLTLKNLVLDGTKATVTTRKALIEWNAGNTSGRNFTAENLIVQNSFTGLYLRNLNGSIKITKSQFLEVAPGDGGVSYPNITLAVFVSGGTGNVEVDDCRFVNTYTPADATLMPGGIEVHATDASNQITTKVVNSYFEKVGCDNVLGAIGAVDLYDFGKDSVIANNRFVNSYASAIKVANAPQLVVANNIIKGSRSGVDSAAIYVSGAARASTGIPFHNFTVDNNTVTGWDNYAAQIQGASGAIPKRWLVSNNIFDGNKRGVVFGYVGDIDWVNNTISNGTGALANESSALYLLNMAGQTLRIRGGKILDNPSYGLLADDSSNDTATIDIQGTLFRSSSTDNIRWSSGTATGTFRADGVIFEGTQRSYLLNMGGSGATIKVYDSRIASGATSPSFTATNIYKAGNDFDAQFYSSSTSLIKMTLPPSAATLAGLGLAQTFSAQQTFSAGVNVTGGNFNVTGGTVTDRAAQVTSEAQGNSFYWGHPNSGYKNTVGALSSTGYPFFCFYCYHSATANTFKRSSASNLPIRVQATNAGEIEFYLAPAGTVDADISDFSKILTINSAGVVTSGTPQTLTGAGAVNTTSDTTILVTTGANALTLADGTAGQSKTIVMKTDGGDGTLTPTNLAGATTITFNDAGDTVTLKFIDGKWYIVGSYGVTIA